MVWVLYGVACFVNSVVGLLICWYKDVFRVVTRCLIVVVITLFWLRFSLFWFDYCSFALLR